MRIALAVLVLPLVAVAAEVRCHSCLTHCASHNGGKVDAKTCDCRSEEKDMCSGQACFAKLEIFADESTAIMQKGCITDIPGGKAGCHYAANEESIHCFCGGEQCNTRQELGNFVPARLPTVECCVCSEKSGDKCLETCAHRCRGNYCVVDFDGKEQGCGLGIPRLPSFLRTADYTQWQGGPICARYEASSDTVMNGCTCTEPSGGCNNINKTRSYQLEKTIERRADNQNYCYSLQHKSSAPFGQEVFKKSTTCEGQYCFLSLTTSEIVLESADFAHREGDHSKFVGLTRPRYEILAGCLKVDDDRKVVPGCTTEYSSNETQPITRHCVCDSHLCNFHHLLEQSNRARAVPTRPPAIPRPGIKTAAKSAAFAPLALATLLPFLH